VHIVTPNCDGAAHREHDGAHVVDAQEMARRRALRERPVPPPLHLPGDFDRSLEFYRDVLGWAVTDEWGGDGQDRGAILSDGG
jgi:hypothetical protein